MQERIQFWSNSALWPANVPGYVFAARAVHEVGKVVHGDAWTGNEPTTANPLNLRRIVLPDGSTAFAPSQAVASRTVKETINALLWKFRPEFERKPVVYGPHGPEPLSFSAEEWQVGMDLAEVANQKLVSAQKRLNDAIASIISACAEGHLISALRPKAGGRMGDPLPNYIWHTEGAANRFFWCQMSPTNPYGHGIGGDGHQYIYFGKDSLDSYSQLLADAAKPKPDRTTKTDYKIEKLEAWATELFNSVENNQRPIFTQAEFEAMAREEFPGVSIPKLRKEVWVGRPALFPRKAAKGA